MARSSRGWLLRGMGMLLLGLGTACGGSGGSGDATGTPPFVVPALPNSLDAGGFNNQPPPDAWLVPEFSNRPLVERVPLTPAERATAERDGKAFVEAWLSAAGIDAKVGVVVTHVLQDEYGGVHVKMEQTYEGVPVRGQGAVSHHHPDVADHLTDNVLRGLSLSTTPTVSESDAIATAVAAHGSAPVPLFNDARLAIEPTLTYVRTGSAHAEDHTDDFEHTLVAATLVYEIVVGPVVPDDETLIQTMLDVAPVNTEPEDAALRAARTENATHGGNDLPEEAAAHAPMAFLDEVAVRYLIDASTGAILSSRPLVEGGGLFDLNDHMDPEKGEGYSWGSGKVDIDTSSYKNKNGFALVDLTRPTDCLGNVVWEAYNQDTYDASDMDMMADIDNTWGDGSVVGTELASNLGKARRQTPAVDIAYGMQLMWDVLKNVMGRDGPDGDGTSIKAAAHFGSFFDNARYDRNSRFVVFGDGEDFSDAGLIKPVWVGHEFGHRHWDHSGLGSELGESSAMNEGHGDILGSFTTFYRDTADGKGTLMRRSANFDNWQTRLRRPSDYTESDSGQPGYRYWSSDFDDTPDEHAAGIPFGRAVIYLAEGAPSDPADDLYTSEWPGGLGAIGLHKAARIWNTATAYYAQGTPTYASMRTAFIQAAQYLYGQGSMEERAVKRAFAGIRVGAGVADTQDPQVHYAQIYDVDLKDMTARVYAYVDDDTGLKETRVTDGSNMTQGTFQTADLSFSYISIMRAPLGQSSYKIEVEDGAGRTTSVFRSFTKARDRNLIANGDFETPLDAATDWTNTSGIDRARMRPDLAFIGNGYLAMRGHETVWQEVTIPASAKDVSLVYRILVRNATNDTDLLAVRVENTSGDQLELLETYGAFTSRSGRTWLNKGYAREAFDLSDYAGQTIRISFENDTIGDNRRFNIDQVALTYTEDVFIEEPDVTLREWENTASFQLPEIQGLFTNEIERVVYFVDWTPVAISTRSSFHWFTSVFLDDLGPGPHWVGARLLGLDGEILGHSGVTWFVPKAKPELLSNGDFESGNWDPTYTDIAPMVEVVEDTFNQQVSFDGEHVLRMGGTGVQAEHRAGKVVQVLGTPFKSLHLSCRVRVQTTESDDDDRLQIELWDAQTFTKIQEFTPFDSDDVTDVPGLRDYFRGYQRRDIELSPGKYKGKSLLILFRVIEDDGLPTTFWIDNVSLRYANYGIQGN